MNEQWQKEQNIMEDKLQLHEYRITQLETSHGEMKEDIKEIKEIVNRLDKKLSTVPDTGFQCPIHQIRMDILLKQYESLDARQTKIEEKTNSISDKIIRYGAIGSVVIWLFINGESAVATIKTISSPSKIEVRDVVNYPISTNFQSK
jgi:hypothetical protein